MNLNPKLRRNKIFSRRQTVSWRSWNCSQVIFCCLGNSIMILWKCSSLSQWCLKFVFESQSPRQCNIQKNLLIRWTVVQSFFKFINCLYELVRKTHVGRKVPLNRTYVQMQDLQLYWCILDKQPKRSLEVPVSQSFKLKEESFCKVDNVLQHPH